jgi:hypothetical protein
LGKGERQDMQGGEEKEKPHQEKKGCKKEVKGSFVQFDSQKSADRADNNEEEGPKYGKPGDSLEGSQEKGAPQEHKQQPGYKGKARGKFAGC